MCMAIVSCESQPQVTACQEQFIEEAETSIDYWGNISFKGVKRVPAGWLHWDDNKTCPHQNTYKFRVLKHTSTSILKSDICDYCHYTWSLHD